MISWYREFEIDCSIRLSWLRIHPGVVESSHHIDLFDGKVIIGFLDEHGREGYGAATINDSG